MQSGGDRAQEGVGKIEEGPAVKVEDGARNVIITIILTAHLFCEMNFFVALLVCDVCVEQITAWPTQWER